MAQINKPTDYFNTKLYTGNGSTQSITGVGFQPDWVWIKNRDRTDNHVLYDSIRTATKRLSSNTTDVESTKTNGLTSFDSDGFSVGSASENNHSATNLVSWNWLAGGTASSNTDGSITSNVSANTTSGFSIVSYTGTGVNATVGHGLGVAPKVVICKTLDTTGQAWTMYHASIGATKELRLNTTGAAGTSSTRWQDTDPTSSVFYVGTEPAVNYVNTKLIAYCFAEKQGFSKFGSYTGNGSTDGTFVYTGFKPAFVMVKNTTDTGDNWNMYDNKRDIDNTAEKLLFANSSSAEITANNVDILSNGFKQRNTSNGNNGSGDTYIYMCFASEPLVGTNNIPATAR